MRDIKNTVSTNITTIIYIMQSVWYHIINHHDVDIDEHFIERMNTISELNGSKYNLL